MRSAASGWTPRGAALHGTARLFRCLRGPDTCCKCQNGLTRLLWQIAHQIENAIFCGAADGSQPLDRNAVSEKFGIACRSEQRQRFRSDRRYLFDVLSDDNFLNRLF